MNKKLLIIASLVLGAGVLFTTTSSALAYNCTPERHEAMTRAFENKDYNAWKELRQGKGKVTQVVNEGNFNRFAEMHRLRLEGKTDEANQIRTELGLGMGKGYGGTNR